MLPDVNVNTSLPAVPISSVIPEKVYVPVSAVPLPTPSTVYSATPLSTSVPSPINSSTLLNVPVTDVVIVPPARSMV